MIEDLAEQEEIKRAILQRNIPDVDIIEKMAKTNSFEYNLEKCVEELLELGEVLMKRKLKAGSFKAPTNQSIIEEIGDVQIRIDVLKKIFGQFEVEKRVENKLSTYKGYFSEGKYIGRI